MAVHINYHVNTSFLVGEQDLELKIQGLLAYFAPHEPLFAGYSLTI